MIKEASNSCDCLKNGRNGEVVNCHLYTNFTKMTMKGGDKFWGLLMLISNVLRPSNWIGGLYCIPMDSEINGWFMDSADLSVSIFKIFCRGSHSLKNYARNSVPYLEYENGHPKRYLGMIILFTIKY